MKAAKTTLRALLLAAATGAVMVALSSCPNPVGEMLKSDGWGLLGTWVATSGAASGNPGSCYRLTVDADGTFQSQDFGATINITGTYLMESASVSGNVRTLKIHFTYSGSMNDYVLAKVTDGTTYESVYTNLLPYPTTISVVDASYKKFTLQ